MKDLVFEIGTEELPAGFIPRVLKIMDERLTKEFEKARLTFKGVRTLGTPRRLTLIVEGLDDIQPDTSFEMRGPRKDAAFDGSNNPTKALQGFMKGQGVGVKDIKTVKTEKGEYVYALKKVKGEKTQKILPEILTNLLATEFSAKSMRWGDNDVSFARPVHWILALYGTTTVPLEFGHIKSCSSTRGHRFFSPAAKKGAAKPFKIGGAKAYVEGLAKHGVVVDPQERKRMIMQGLKDAASKVNGTVLSDEGLVEEVTYLVEYPVVVMGSFEKEFLDLPRDVVINAMREHQRYFSVVDKKGNLLPHFITVANTQVLDPDVVKKGNERVLRARLNDAKFYYDQDVRTPLAERTKDLKGVVFQAKLGTSYEKVERFTALALFIGEKVGFCSSGDGSESVDDFLSNDQNPVNFDSTKTDPGFYSRLVLGRAAALAKADLTTGMVGEFPKLQGTMGSIYAAKEGEVPEVGVAVYEHYLPIAAGATLPATVPGSLVSIADKLDTMAGCFGVGIIPTGAQDPYALRRQALGIINVILDKGFSVPLDMLVDKAVSLVGEKLTKEHEEAAIGVLDFIKERLRNQLLMQDLSFDTTDAVLSTNWYDINDAVKRVRSLEGFKKHPECASLVIAFKRVSNILKGCKFANEGPDPKLFEDAEETALYETREKIAPLIDKYWSAGDYEKVFETLASIRPNVDAFFDEVMVMVDDEKIKRNRLLLLNSLKNLYFRIADLSKLVVEETK